MRAIRTDQIRVAAACVIAASLTAVPTVHAQDSHGRQRFPSSVRATAQAGGVVAQPRELAQPRATAPQRTAPQREVAVPRTSPPPASPPPARVAASPAAPVRAAVPPAAVPRATRAGGAGYTSLAQERAVPRSRPRGDTPRTGTAVPRQGPPPPPRGSGGTIYTRPPRIYNNYSYYPRNYSPYGYGGFGLGYFYYDPYAWSPLDRGYYGSGYGYGSRYDADRGELRLDVRPRDAEVYVDGYFAGIVDDFDGTFQALSLDSGRYKIEIVAPGYEPLDFDVQITPGRKIRYRGELLRQRP